MQIDKADAAIKTAVIAGAIGITVTAPYLGIFVAPFLTPFLKEIAKAGIDTFSNVGANALWDLRGSFSPSRENEDLTRLLGNAYFAAIDDVLRQAENDEAFGNHTNLIKFILPSIKEEIDIHLATNKETDLYKLFPTEENLAEIAVVDEQKVSFLRRIFGKKTEKFKAVDEDLLTNISAEEFILKISDNAEEAKKLRAEEVEICLRRWFVQLNPTLAEKYTFPPSLNKFVFEKIGDLIPQKINELVKEKNLDHSWLAFQRSHLQAILKEVNNLSNGLSEDDRKLLRPLGESLEKLSENNDLVKKLADSHLTVLSKIGESEENIKQSIAAESLKLRDWLENNFDEIKQSLMELHEKFDNFNVQIPQNIKFRSQMPPNMEHKVYGRENELRTLKIFLETEKEHPAIVGMTCLGKTSLIRKFLYKNYDQEKNESLLPEVFTDVSYLDCGQNLTFENLLQHFNLMMQTAETYTEGKKSEFWKDKIFLNFGERKVLLIFDNFESWQNDGEYLNEDIKTFLETFLANPCGARAVFLSWFLPHKEKEFYPKVKSLKSITEELEEGLAHDDAVELVRKESEQYCGEDSLIDLNRISENELTEFFLDVSYNPQSIQSMVHFIGRKQCTFKEFLDKYQEAFDAEESDETDLDGKRGKILRPAKALIRLQISLLNPKAEQLLRHIAFYGIDVPQDILVLDLENIKTESEENRAELNRLANDRLVIRTVNRFDREPFAVYNLHEFVRRTVKDNLPEFLVGHQIHLESLADGMYDKQNNAWENKFFNRQNALVECWEKLEDYFVNIQKRSDRQFQRDSVDFTRALAAQEIAEANAAFLTKEQIIQLFANAEKLYQDFLQKYPNYAGAYNNLGVLLAKDESRLAEAEEKYNKVIELNPNFAVAYNNLGVLLDEDQSRLAEAEEKYNKAIELNPNYAEAYYNLGILLARQEKDFDKSEIYFRNAIGINPQFLMAYQSLAVLKAFYGSEDDKDEIFDLLVKIIEMDKSQIEFVKEFAEVEFIRDDPRFAEIIGGDDD